MRDSPKERRSCRTVPAAERDPEDVGLARDGERGDVDDRVGVPALVVRPGHALEAVRADIEGRTKTKRKKKRKRKRKRKRTRTRKSYLYRTLMRG